MTKPLLFSLFTSVSFLQSLEKHIKFDIGRITLREFPDHESYIKFDSDVKDRQIIFIASLDNPNSKFLPLVFALRMAKELGAKNIGLILPYLPYMRQDKQFLPGEAVTSKYFSKMISDCVDWMITIDPHLHRYHSLSEIYSIPTYVLQANELIKNWIQQHISHPIIIGPDSESEQWAAAIANSLHAPLKILSKTRKGDTHVQIEFPDLSEFGEFTPILVDDIISTGTTMIETIKHLKQIKMQAPICIGVHAVFSQDAYKNIILAGAKSIVTCNTIEHISNSIDVAPLIAQHLTTLDS